MTKELENTKFGKMSLRDQVAYQDTLSKKKFLNVREACMWLGFGRKKIYALIKDGCISAFQFPGGSYWYIDVEETKKNFKAMTGCSL